MSEGGGGGLRGTSIGFPCPSTTSTSTHTFLSALLVPLEYCPRVSVRYTSCLTSAGGGVCLKPRLHTSPAPRSHKRVNLHGLMISWKPSLWHSAVYLVLKRRGFSSLTLAREPVRGLTEMNTPEVFRCVCVGVRCEV